MRDICVARQISEVSGDEGCNRYSTQVVLILKLQCRLEDGFKKEEFNDMQTNFQVPAES